MEFLFDPALWAGLVTLIVLEIVLGIDNLIFIAILSDKLPPAQRRNARVLGLGLALCMRILLLACISWLSNLTTPLFTLLDHGVSIRDLIELIGGAFLLFKGTVELHEKLEGAQSRREGPIRYARFWPVIIQIVVLDAVFSLDSVITAVGMTDHLLVMMLAVCIAMVLMIIASNALMDFVSDHPTVVILCLGFLLMIGFSLMVEGMGYHIPKGYLYAAIGFSVLVEAFNQMAQHNRRKTYKKIDPRTRLSEAVIGLLGIQPGHSGIEAEISGLAPKEEEPNVFKPQEQFMIRRVLQLSDQPVRAIMTPRHELYWIDLADDEATLAKDIRECPYSCMVAARGGSVDEPLGIVFKKDLADLLLEKKGGLNELESLVRQPIAVPDVTTVLQALDAFQKSRIHVAFIIDEYGSLEGLVTLTDVVEAIAGDMPEEHEEDEFQFQQMEDGSISINGNLTIQELQEVLGGLELPEGDYNTAAGIALNVLRRLPKKGDTFSVSGWHMTIQEMDGRRVSRIKVVAENPKEETLP
jgi:CBS domain containing-hemolysin-like protein